MNVQVMLASAMPEVHPTPDDVVVSDLARAQQAATRRTWRRGITTAAVVAVTAVALGGAFSVGVFQPVVFQQSDPGDVRTPQARAAAVPAPSAEAAPPLVTVAAPPPAVVLPQAASAGLSWDFETGTEDWSGRNVVPEPYTVVEWAVNGQHSLRVDVPLGLQKFDLHRERDVDLTAGTTLTASARIDPEGVVGSGVTARLFVKTGDDWQWHEGPPVPVTASGAPLSLDLTAVGDRANVREIGIEYLTPADSKGTAAVYVDHVVIS